MTSDLSRLTEAFAAQSIEDVRTQQKKTAADLEIVLRHALLAATGGPPSADELQEELSNRRDQSTQNPPPIREVLAILTWLQELIEESPYSTLLHYYLALVFIGLQYSDLGAGSLYKALLLLDAIEDESDEYHEQARETFEEEVARQIAAGVQWDVEVLTGSHRTLVLKSLVSTLKDCGCLKSAHLYATQGAELDDDFGDILDDLEEAALARPDIAEDPSTWPDHGLVRRERYPWNTYEPDRLNDLETLNEMMQAVAPKLEVKAARLPALSATTDDHAEETVQLGVFAKEDLIPGDVVLKETSLLTANNKLQDALCDACSIELPELSDPAVVNTLGCEDCEVVFCSQSCHDAAWASYHPALCDRDVESIAKDVPVEQASDSLYSLLLLRSFAMAETQECHPLELKEVKYIWGDFNDIDYTKGTDLPRSLPFNFKNNVTLPFHMLEKMDIDIFANIQYDVWVFNTLYAKFRGTASARLSGLGGRAIRGPEVCAVHPMWCLANHSCDPNVSWRWGGEIRFTVRNTRAIWQGMNEACHNEPGVKKGEEILNHYCDLDLPVKQRREWAAGALGGNCMCERCIWESQQATE